MAVSWDDGLASDFSDEHSLVSAGSPCYTSDSTQCSNDDVTSCVIVHIFNRYEISIRNHPNLTVGSVIDIAIHWSDDDLIDPNMDYNELILFYYDGYDGDATVAEEGAFVNELYFENDPPEFFLDEKSWYDLPVKMLGEDIVRFVRVHSLQTLAETNEKVALMFDLDPDDFDLIYEDDVINHYQILTRIPLNASDIQLPVSLVVTQAIIYLKFHNLVPVEAHYTHFVLSVCNGYELGYGGRDDGIVKMSDYLHDLDRDTFTLTYYPNFEVQLVLVCDEQRRIRVEDEFCGKTHVEDVKKYLVFEHEMDFDEIRLIHRGVELEDDDEQLGDIFGLTSNIADPYGLYELQVMVKGRGGGKSKASLASSSDVKTVLKSLKKDKVSEIKDATSKLNSEIMTKVYQSGCLKEAQGIIKFLNDIPETQSLQVFTNAVSVLGMDAVKECREILKGEKQKDKRVFATTEEKAEAIAKKMLVVIGQIETHIEEANKVKNGVLMNFLKHYYNFSMKGTRCDNSVLDGLLETRLIQLQNLNPSVSLDGLTKMMENAHL
eukprot:symbB.v1.2.023542.t1/scaffold2146.1/size87984/1